MTLQVTGSKKDFDGDIAGLCGYGWSHTKSQAIANIRVDARAHSVSAGGKTVYVRVGSRYGTAYLTPSPDRYSPKPHHPGRVLILAATTCIPS